MKINGIDVKFNGFDQEECRKFSDAYVEVSYKAKKVEDKLQNGEISKQEYQEKGTKIIKKFFKKVLPKATAQALIDTCSNYDDYLKIFSEITQMICTVTASLQSIAKIGKRIDKKE